MARTNKPAAGAAGAAAAADIAVAEVPVPSNVAAAEAAIAAPDDGARPSDLASADPAAIAAQLVSGEPNPALVEAVRRVLAGEVPTLKAIANADASVRLGFPVLMHLRLDGDGFEPGEFAFVTEDEFYQLQRDHVFSKGLDWEDGQEAKPQSPPQPE